MHLVGNGSKVERALFVALSRPFLHGLDGILLDAGTTRMVKNGQFIISVGRFGRRGFEDINLNFS